MENKNTIKIVFSNKYEENALSFEEFENAVIDAIKDCKKASFRVFLRNPMPLSEFNSVVSELCGKIKPIHGNIVNFSRNNECFGEKNNLSGIVSATYYIELR
ncbi:MAG: hypothetical protein SPL78_10060 [Bacteroidales bacterium]|nr:hypothetical protein [Bacteroidales bacterium]